MTLTKTQRRRLVALSSIVGIMIGISITVTAGGTLFYTFQSQTDQFATSSSIEIRNLNAVLKDDTLKLTANVKNTGQASITAIFIDSITVSEISIEQDEYGILTLTDSDSDDTDYCEETLPASGVVIACSAAEDARGFSISTNGHQSGTGALLSPSTLEGGRTNALVMAIDNDSLDTDVNITDKLNLVLRFTLGQDELVTDVFTTRVKPG